MGLQLNGKGEGIGREEVGETGWYLKYIKNMLFKLKKRNKESCLGLLGVAL